MMTIFIFGSTITLPLRGGQPTSWHFIGGMSPNENTHLQYNNHPMKNYSTSVRIPTDLALWTYKLTLITFHSDLFLLNSIVFPVQKNNEPEAFTFLTRLNICFKMSLFFYPKTKTLHFWNTENNNFHSCCSTYFWNTSPWETGTIRALFLFTQSWPCILKCHVDCNSQEDQKNEISQGHCFEVVTLHLG